MQCPACNHIPLAGNQPDPNRCPSCGTEYATAIRERAQQAQQVKQLAAEKQQAINAIGLNVRKAMAAYRGAQPVVVIDIRMSFWSMVVFMVKWAIAAIPALLILALLAGFASSLFFAVPAFFEYKAKSEALVSSVVPSVKEEQIYVPVPAQGKFFALAVSKTDSIAAMTVRTEFSNGDVAFSRAVFDCRNGTAAITASAVSLQGLEAGSVPYKPEQLIANQPRTFIGKHACAGMPNLHPLLR